MKSKITLLLLAIVMLFSVTGCYWNEVLAPNQVAVQLDEGEIKAVSEQTGGKYSDMGFFADLLVVNIDTITFSVEDPEVLTSDNQAVAMKITIQARRNGDSESIKNMVRNWYGLLDDAKLQEVISATAREGMKNGVRGYTLFQLLDDRNGLGNAIRDQLEADAQKYSVQIVNVTIENVGASQKYMETLAEKANLSVETAKELERQKLIEQVAQNNILQAQKDVLVKQAQLLVEQAKTAVEVEIAKREGEKTAAAQSVYSLNPQAFQLRQLELLQGIIGDGTVYYLPVGTDLTTVFGLPGLTGLAK